MATQAIKGASMPKSELNPYGVGLLRLSELHIQSKFLAQKDIVYIDQCSINRKKVIIGKVGEEWAVKGREKDLERKYGARYGGPGFVAHYAITGKRSVCIFKDPNREHLKPLHLMTTREIFNAGKGHPTRKHAAKTRLKVRLAYAERIEKF